MAKNPTIRKRPLPPEFPAGCSFMPAPEVLAWIRAEILAEDGTIHNPDHKHLQDADLQVLWADGGFSSKQRTVVGTAEEVMFRCNAWQKGRQEQQLADWFGDVPKFLITLDARYAAECDDVAWCALVEHELYHVAHLENEFGPMFTREGAPKLGIKGHDVEEFVGVVERYGIGAPDGALARMVKAANRGATVAERAIAGACGTCLRLVA